MEQKRILVGIIDDHKVFRMGIETCLKLYPEINVVFHASNGRELLEKLEHHPVDLILLDLDMPGLSGIDALKEIRKTNKELKVIILTMHDEDSYIIKLVEESANAYLLKDTDPDELYFAIQSCIQFGSYYSNTIRTVLFKKLYHENKFGMLYPTKEIEFTERELKVMNLICEEKTTQEIAKILFTSDRTIDGIRRALLSKIGAKNTIGIALYAIRQNIFFKEN